MTEEIKDMGGEIEIVDKVELLVDLSTVEIPLPTPEEIERGLIKAFNEQNRRLNTPNA